MRVAASVPTHDKKHMLLLIEKKASVTVIKLNYKEAKYLRNDIDHNLSLMEKPK